MFLIPASGGGESAAPAEASLAKDGLRRHGRAGASPPTAVLSSVYSGGWVVWSVTEKVGTGAGSEARPKPSERGKGERGADETGRKRKCWRVNK